jgi:AraC family transcriptional regulator
LDGFKVMVSRMDGHGRLRTFDGAIVRRVIDRSHASVREHAHDWPLISLFVLGGYWNRTEAGERRIDEPSAVYYRPGTFHQNTASINGFEQLEIEFDPAWLRPLVLPDAPVLHWIGGPVGRDVRRFSRICSTANSDDAIREALYRFLAHSPQDSSRKRAPWIYDVRRRLEADPSLRVAELAREIDRHPSWLGAVYSNTMGEGLPESAARFRLERACRLLRESALPFAQVAAEAGFCDQSHMNRTFRRILDRTPSAVREDRRFLRQS